MRLAFKAFKGILLRALFTQLPENDKLISSLGYPPHYAPSCGDGKGKGDNGDKEKEEGECGHSNNTIKKTSLKAENMIRQSLVDLEGMSTIEDAVEALKRQFPSVTVESKQKSTDDVIIVEGLDAVIVGSGPGGSITAYNLTQAGLKVAVLEKSTFVPATQFPMTERQAFERLYEAHGLLSSEDASISILAGSTLGGGSRVNWCASFKTPDHVLKEWAAKEGGKEDGGEGDNHFQQQSEGLQKMFGSPEYKQGLDSVCKRLGVRTGFTHSTNCTLLAQGLENIAADCEDVPRNCGDNDCSGLCQFGCGRGEKQDAVVTYLADVCGSRIGAKIVTGVMADIVVVVENVQDEKDMKKKRATGVVAKTTTGGIRIIFKAPIVISSAGAIHTPALLLRSKIAVDIGGVQGIGSNLRLHPCTVIIAKFDKDETDDSSPPHPQSQSHSQPVVQAWNGPIMSKYSTQLAEWNGSGYGAVVYNVSPHPGMFAAGLPWNSGADMKRLLADFEKSVCALVLVRDRGSGQVKIDGAGAPRIVYALAEEDKETMLGGMKLACRALKAAGATAVSLINGQEYQFKKKMDNGIGNNGGNNNTFDDDGEEAEFEHWLNADMTVPDRDLVCAHQMGTAALGTVLDGDTGECKSVSGLYVCDASCFPTSLGVNPMITVYGIANMISNGIAKRYVGKKEKETERGVHHQLAYEQE
jgi:long-chain-alcohol oxidase